MWGVALIFIAVANCNAELYQLKTTDLPASVDNRIIGGSATTIQHYPFTVQVLYRSQFYCGGSLVTTKFVLSAAHCFVDENGYVVSPSLYSIREGTTILNSGGTLHQVTAIKVHELYNTPVRDNDVAVVLMLTDVNLTTSIARPAIIPYQNAVVPDNANVIAVGWGLTNVNNSASSTVLNEVTVRKINQNICQARYKSLQDATGFPFPVTSNMICAGILDVGGKDACRGDSGGPLIYNGVVVGVTSWGNGCAEPNYPGVFARVASFTNWVNYTINDSMLQILNLTGNSNGTGDGIYPGSTGSLGSKVGAITLLTPLLFLILCV